MHRFTLVKKTNHACTALAFCTRRKSEILVAQADYVIKCVNAGNAALLYLLSYVVTIIKFKMFLHEAVLNVVRSLSRGSFGLRSQRGGGHLDWSPFANRQHLRPRIRSLRADVIVGRSASVGPGHVRQETEVECERGSRHRVG